ncbi:alpha-aspartyl dipeptidase isoform X4 [Euwallacea fornicatus]|uniref:alpha-aspartyl dipeptidase isoform X4 n=1 Tax=Euwallacea fornicatus TaxID=995702 RepID=UPI00338F7A26
MAKRQLLLLSSSRVHGFDFLEYAAQDINDLLAKNNVSTVLFIPYALTNHDKYLQMVQQPFQKWGFKVESIHNLEEPVEAIQRSEAIFVGGGNTFRLLKALYDNNLIQPIRNRVLKHGIPYISASADADLNSKHKGETRQQRIEEYLEEDDSSTVLGLREGGTLYVEGSNAFLKGISGARLFVKGKEPLEIQLNSDLSQLLKED